jgi:sec-independent protein translocase protein TatA
MSIDIIPLQIIGTEWLWVIFVVIVLLFGGKKVPEIARALGKAVAEFQKGRMEFERELRLTQEQIMELPKAIGEPVNLNVSPSTPQTQAQTAQPASVSEEEPVKPVEKEIDSSQKLLEIAQKLGINTEGKTNEQLKEEIKKALESLE